jgi:hypothetical protein
MEVINQKYYLPNQFNQELLDGMEERDIPVPYLENGMIDAIRLLNVDLDN